MHTARLIISPSFVIAPVSRRTFGSFVEHLGRCVYTGIFEPDHPTADEAGFRTDVKELVRELGVSTVRYPGGNFVSGFRWEDSVGPVEDRPRRLDLAWHSLEPNAVGLHEFMTWAESVEIEPMMALNLGTRGVQEALDLHEYCNVSADTAWTRQRRANGREAPYGIKMWCLGNEMDGPWQLGHKTPLEYGRLAAETARAMRMVEPDLQLIVCGSSASDMPLFGEWERVVLAETFEFVDYVSIHRYYEEKADDLASFLGSALDMDRFIEDVVSTVDHVAAVKKSSKKINLSFDEWNVWYQSRAESEPPKDEWPIAPTLLEDHYTAADAVVVGNMLITLLRHSDRVTAASQAQLVNVIAPIMTEPGGRAWRQTIFHPFALTSRYARGAVLRMGIESASFESAAHGAVSSVDAVATWDEASGDVAIFVVNRNPSESVSISVDLEAFGAVSVIEAVTLCHSDPRARNSADEERVQPVRLPVQVNGDTLTVELSAVSWSMIRVEARAI